MKRKKRKVRMHLQEGPTIEGILVGRTRREYVLWAPTMIQSTDPVELPVSGHVEVPRERVLFYQVL
jgi:hypothetical protein